MTLNTVTRDFQAQVASAALAEDRFAVVWNAIVFPQERPQSGGDVLEGGDKESSEIRGRLVDAGGVALGAADFQVSDRSDRYYVDPTVAGAGDGFLVAWSDQADPRVDGRLFDPAGTPLGSQIVLTGQGGDEDSSDQANLVGLGGGGYVLSWTSNASGSDGSGFGLSGLRLDAAGSPVGGSFRLNSFTAGNQFEPHLAVGAGDVLFATWTGRSSPGDDDSGRSVIGRVLQLPGELGDLVFRDDDLDGRQDVAEPGVAGVNVTLLGESGEALGQTSTDADGGYRFYLTESASVGLAFEAPDGLSFTAADLGDDALDSDADPVTGEVAPFSAPLGGVDRTRDAGLGAGLGDRIWLDVDANGVQDVGEAGLPGVTVTLYDAADSAVDQTTSDADGRYAFFGPAAGAYYLEVTAPAGFEFTARDRGDDDADSDVNAAGRSSTFLVIEGSIDTAFDAGLVPVPVGSIGDRVWRDDNLNGVQDVGERGFRDVVVELFDANGAPRGTVTTDAGGAYSFTDLAAGSYYLAFSEPAGFCFTARDVGNDDGADSDVDPETFTTSLFSLAGGDSDGTRDAGLVPDASIGNRVWLDDGDGIQTGGEVGVGNVTVRLYDASDALLGTTATDSGGHYAFSPGPGDYYLEFLLPDDTAFAPRDQGGGTAEADQLDRDVIAATGTTTVFTLGPGQVDTSRDAGLEPAVVGN
ncbi:MAG: SdrD B-like domain-containing protein, partial [Acidobacteriota bacterium]